MRYGHFPLVIDGFVRAQPECPASMLVGSYIGMCQQVLAWLLTLCILGLYETCMWIVYSLQFTGVFSWGIPRTELLNITSF